MVGRSLALATFTAVGALLAGLSGAQAQTAPQESPAPGAGGFPGSFLVPGTNTSLKIGGYAKVDYQYDESTDQNCNANGSCSSALVYVIPLNDNIHGAAVNPAASIHGDSHLSAAESRFNIETRTPTGYGELKTFIEGDFEGTSGVTPGNTFELNSDRTAFSLRNAYGTLGPLLAGQYFSLFEDPAAFAETLDFGGPVGLAGPARQPQFRYVYAMPNGVTLAASLENSQTFVISTQENNVNLENGSSTFNLGQGEKTPDLVVAAIFSQGPGHIAIRAVARDLYDHGPASINNAVDASSADAFGWGVGVSGDLHILGPDDIVAQVQAGDGMGRYGSNAGEAPGDSVISANGQKLVPVREASALLGYQHFWTRTLRSNINASILQVEFPNALFQPQPGSEDPDAPTGALGSLNHRLVSSHVNLIWSPVPPVDLGIEQMWEERRTEAGQTGHIIRTQVSAKFKF
jgi:hypothetical protein